MTVWISGSGDRAKLNRQGNDTGIQYRTGIYYTDEKQLPEIEAVYQEEERKTGARLAVELEPIKNYFSAEEYHRNIWIKIPADIVILRTDIFIWTESM